VVVRDKDHLARYQNFVAKLRAVDIKVDSTSGTNPQLKYAREAAANAKKRLGAPAFHSN